MELVKVNLSVSRQKSKAITYVSKEEAFNLNESMEDISRILQNRAQVTLQEVRGEENKVRVLGEMSFSILYESASLEKHLSAYNGRMSFEEEINMEGVEAGDDISVNSNLEQLKIEIVNSRKIRVNAMLSLIAAAQDSMQEEIAADIEADNEQIQTKKGNLKYLNKTARLKENEKLETDVTIPAGNENIGKIIWYKVTPYNLDFTGQDGQILFSGDLQVFAIYQSENGAKTEFVHEEVPFQKTITADVCSEGAILSVNADMSAADADVAQDYDGEDRKLHITGVIDLDIELYREENVEYIEDLYSLKNNVIPKVSMVTCQKLLSQNTSKCRVNEPVNIEKTENPVLQLLNSDGKISDLKYSQQEGGVLVQGNIEVGGLSVTSDDEQPYENFSGVVPFEHMVEIPNMDIQSEYQCNVRLDQLSVSMAGENSIEVKALVTIVVIAYDIILYPVILDIQESEPDTGAVKKIPGITGYVVREDDTLWDIAKRYMTTIDEIKDVNELKSDSVNTGDKLIIVKTINCSNAVK